MDDRRLSARADIAGAAPSTRTTAPTAFLDRAIDLTRANWEIIFYIAIMAIAIFTRTWDLGARALHHDESIHAYYSNQYFKGGGYNYDPVYHGPFLYTIVGLGFTLFGVSDATARIMPAIFGLILVGACWFLRPFIGRVGTIIAMLLVTLSPSISYYSRSLRHDIFALTGTLVMFVCILWFLRTHQARYFYIGVAALAVAYTSHELTYIIVLIFGLYLAIGALTYRFFSGANSYAARGRRVEDDVNPVSSALQSLGRQRWTIVGGLVIFLAIFTVLYTNLLTKFAYESQTFRPKDGSGPAPTVPFFTSLIEGVAYWLGQHEVQRGNQPQYYYLLMMPVYEPLAFLAGIGTLIYAIVSAVRGGMSRFVAWDDSDANVTSPTDEYGVHLPSITSLRGFTLGFLAFWSFGALIAFSLAGERMPWLLMQSALPFTLLASMGLGRLLSLVNWKEASRGGGAFLGVAVLLMFFSAISLLRFLTGQTPKSNDGLVNGMQGLLLALFTVGLLALVGWISYKILPSRALAVVAGTFAIVLALYGLRSMVLVNYSHGDVPIEMLVYTQSAPDVPIVADQIKRLSRDETAFDAGRSAADVTGGRSLQIGVDSLVEWPFDWYFRDMRNINYYPTNDSANYYWDNAATGPLPPVLIVDDQTVNKPNFQTQTKDKYVSQKYVLRWWFPEDLYKNSDPNNANDFGKALSWVTGGMAGNGGPNFLRYLLYRDPGQPLGSTNFNLYVRNDLAYKIGMQGSNLQTTAPGTTTEDPTKAPAGLFEYLGTATNQRGAFNLPRGIAQDANGDFFVVDTANSRVQKFDSKGSWITSFGSKGTGDGQFNPISDDNPGQGASGIAVDASGNVYVADTWNHRIQKFDNNGKFLAKWGAFINIGDPAAASDADSNSKFYGPRGIAIGPDGNVYVADTGNKRVSIFDASGKFVRKIDSGMNPQKTSPAYPFNKNGEFNEPVGVTVDSQGNVFVADSVNKRIQKFDNKGAFVAAIPIPGNGWDPGSYLEPFLSTDSAGNIYATAPTGKTVYKFSPTGQLLGQKSKQGAAILKTPTGIVVGKDNNVYVVDTAGHGVVNLGTIP